MMPHATLPVADLYVEHRPFLWGLCYRMTGSAADADDLVQETFVRAMERPPGRLDDPMRPWLVKVALNLSRDLLRRRKRREYAGPWLPSPIETAAADGEPRMGDEPPSHEPASFEGRYDLLESVSFAFLLALEALTPTQRAVLILRDVFDYSVKEAAEALDLSEANVKTTHHRARQALEVYHRNRQLPSAAREDATRGALLEFMRCLDEHDVAGIESLLAHDVRTSTDGGGEFQAALRTIVGRDKVTRFYMAVAVPSDQLKVRFARINGTIGAVAEVPGATGKSAPRFTVSVELDAEGKVRYIYVVSASRKLTAIR